MDRLPPLALALVGVLLVANPVWLVPAADEPRYTYRAYDVETTDFEDGNWTDVRRDPEVLDCGVTEPPAACEPYIRATAGPTVTVGEPRYEYLYYAASEPDSPAVRERYYRVERTTVNDTTGMRVEPVPRERVRRTVATELRTLRDPDPLQRAIETGGIATDHQLAAVAADPDGRLLVIHDGSVFLVVATGVDRPEEGALLGGGFGTVVLRGTLATAGVAAAALAWRRHGHPSSRDR